jgi:site-specific DNA recombinase
MKNKNHNSNNTNVVPNPSVGRCAIYARCASSDQGATSTENQIRRCNEYADRAGWTVVQAFVRADVAVSGTSFARRDALRSLMEAAEKRPRAFDRVLIADVARLARNLNDLLQIMNHFQKNGVGVMTIREGFVWPEHRTNWILLGLMDEQYLLELSKKARAKRTRQ